MRFFILPLSIGLALSFEGHSAIYAIPPADVEKVRIELSDDDLKFGRAQVSTMLRDRPQLAEVLKVDDPIFLWASRQLAGDAAFGKQVFWNSDQMNDKSIEYTSDNCYPNAWRKGFIRLRKYSAEGLPINGEKLLSAFVFECFNIQNADEFDQLCLQVRKGKSSENEFIKGMTKLEFKAMQKTAIFFSDVYRPLALKRGQQTTPYDWYCTVPDSYEKWIALYADKAQYPWSYYSPLFRDLQSQPML